MPEMQTAAAPQVPQKQPATAPTVAPRPASAPVQAAPKPAPRIQAPPPPARPVGVNLPTAMPTFNPSGGPLPQMQSTTPSTPSASGTAPTSNHSEQQNRPFTVDQLKRAWVGLTRKLAEDKRVASLLSDTELELPEPNKIIMYVYNPLQIQALGEIKTQIRAYLEEELGNNIFKIYPKVKEQTKQAKAYTTREKLQVLTNSNPKIQDLAEALELQLN